MKCCYSCSPTSTPEPQVRQFTKERFSDIYERVKERFENACIADAGREASVFISCGLIITLSEVLEMPKLSPWCDPD